MIKSLMPCACGGEPTARSLSYLRGRWFWVVCNTCQARSADRTTLDDAAADWNLRAKRNQADARQLRHESDRGLFRLLHGLTQFSQDQLERRGHPVRLGRSADISQ